MWQPFVLAFLMGTGLTSRARTTQGYFHHLRRISTPLSLNTIKDISAGSALLQISGEADLMTFYFWCLTSTPFS